MQEQANTFYEQPYETAAHTMAPVYIVAERGAEFVKAARKASLKAKEGDAEVGQMPFKIAATQDEL